MRPFLFARRRSVQSVEPLRRVEYSQLIERPGLDVQRPVLRVPAGVELVRIDPADYELKLTQSRAARLLQPV